MPWPLSIRSRSETLTNGATANGENLAAGRSADEIVKLFRPHLFSGKQVPCCADVLACSTRGASAASLK
jgi:hypothetical protein